MNRESALRLMFEPDIVAKMMEIFTERGNFTRYTGTKQDLRLYTSDCDCGYYLYIDDFSDNNKRYTFHPNEDCPQGIADTKISFNDLSSINILALEYLLRDGIRISIDRKLTLEEYNLLAKFHYNRITIYARENVPRLSCNSLYISNGSYGDFSNISTNIMIIKYRDLEEDKTISHDNCAAVVFEDDEIHALYDKYSISDHFPHAVIIADSRIKYADIKIDDNNKIIYSNGQENVGNYLTDVIRHYSQSLP